MTNLGFKKLTAENWLEPDWASSSFGSISNGKAEPVGPEGFLCYILKPQLANTVPLEIQRLFEVARSALAYGWFFYPLYTLASEQLFRVAEAAASYKCKELGASPKLSFQGMIDHLVKQNIISKQNEESWQKGIRGLRNICSHPEAQTIYTPGNAIGFLETLASEINSLFISKSEHKCSVSP